MGFCLKDFTSDCFDAINAACFFWRDSKVWKYLAAQAVSSLAFGLLLVLFLVLAVLGLFPSLLNQLPAYLPDSAGYLSQLTPFTQYGVPAAIAFVFFLAAFTVVVAFLYGLVLSRGLATAGFKPTDVSLGMAFKFLLAWLLIFFLALFPLHKRKTLVIQIACYAIALVSALAFGAIGLVVAVVALLAAAVCMAYNTIQLQFTQVILLVNGGGVYQAAVGSVRLIAGKTLRLLTLELVLAIVLFLIVAIIRFPFDLAFSLLSTPSTTGGLAASAASYLIDVFFDLVTGAAMAFGLAAIFKQFSGNAEEQANPPMFS